MSTTAKGTAAREITAKRISRARVGRDAWVYELSLPVHYEQRSESFSTRYVVIQSFWIEARKQSSVVIYPSDEKGDILSFSDLPGSYVGGTDHDKAVRDAGWTLDDKSVRRAPPSANEARECVGPHTHGPVNVVEATRVESMRVTQVQEGASEYRVGDRVEVNIAWPGASPDQAQWIPATVATVGGQDERDPRNRGKVWVTLPGGSDTDLYQGDRLRRPNGASEAQDFPTEDAAVEHAYQQRGGEQLFVYHEGGKYHLAAPGKQPAHAKQVRSLRRSGEYQFGERVPVAYEAGAREQPGQPWPAPEEVTKGGKRTEARETAPVIHEDSPDSPDQGEEHIDTTIVGEDSSKNGDCLPWVRVTRDPERYEACLAQARKIGSIDNSRKVYDLLAPMFLKEDQELLLVVLLDVRRQLRGVAEVNRGHRSHVSASVADTMRVVLTTGSEAFVICHAHPSGNSKPSESDVDLTRTMTEAVKPYGKDITFIGHVVIGVREFHEISASGKVSEVVRVK